MPGLWIREAFVHSRSATLGIAAMHQYRLQRAVGEPSQKEEHRFFPKKCRAFSSEDEHSYQNLFFLYYEFLLTRELTNAQKGVRPFPIQNEHTEIEERRSWGPLNKHAPLETVRDLTSSHKTREQPHPKSNQKRPCSHEAHATEQGR